MSCRLSVSLTVCPQFQIKTIKHRYRLAPLSSSTGRKASLVKNFGEKVPLQGKCNFEFDMTVTQKSLLNLTFLLEIMSAATKLSSSRPTARMTTLCMFLFIFSKILSTGADLYTNICEIIREPHWKTAVLIFDQITNGLMHYCRVEPVFLEETILETLQVMTFDANHYLHSRINDAMAKLLESGIFQRFAKSPDLETFPVVKKPRVLTVGNLSFGFVIFLACCGFAALVFAIETIGACRREKEIQKQRLIKVKFAKVYPIDSVMVSTRLKTSTLASKSYIFQKR